LRGRQGFHYSASDVDPGREQDHAREARHPSAGPTDRARNFRAEQFELATEQRDQQQDRSDDDQCKGEVLGHPDFSIIGYGGVEAPAHLHLYFEAGDAC
jgi:hypothetical protein